ncbi:MAG TPA: hypothetical protein VMS77_04495 [Conexivisphaerales archaeon]|nr:hypothetical protein [Conexivisphaerales archaeon]
MNRPAILAMMVALIVGTDYLLIGLPNVKLMDMLVFLTGLWLGPAYGAAAGCFSWAIYGTVNPLGFNLVTFATVVPMEMLYGVLGGLIGRRRSPSASGMAWRFGLVALLATLAYDLVTNAVTGALFYAPGSLGPVYLPSWAWGIVFGIPLSVVHIASNLLQFIVLAPLLAAEANRVFFRRLEKLA